LTATGHSLVVIATFPLMNALHCKASFYKYAFRRMPFPQSVRRELCEWLPKCWTDSNMKCARNVNNIEHQFSHGWKMTLIQL